MKTRIGLAIALALAFTLPVVTLLVAEQAGPGRTAARLRPQGPCDIYAAAGTPCVAAHSTTRALYASYSGPFYRVHGAKVHSGCPIQRRSVERARPNHTAIFIGCKR